MGDQENDTAQPLRRERRDAERPIRLAAEHVYLIAAAFTIAALAVLIAVDYFAQVWVARGVYALLAAVICVSGTGLIVRLEAARNRRIVCAESAALRKHLAEAAEGAREFGRMARGLDPEVIESVRTIARRIDEADR